jgi:hypothetical protein
LDGYYYGVALEHERSLVSEPSWIRRRALPILTVVAILLLPWTVWLTATLPARHTSEHWDAAWVGFDVVEILALGATVLGIYRHAVWVQVTASVAGTLLLADAWFDILLTAGDEKVWVAVVQAVVAEVPLAALCFWIALDLTRFLLRWADVLRVSPPGVRDRLLHLAAPGESPSESDLVGVLQVAADREPAGEPSDADPRT